MELTVLEATRVPADHVVSIRLGDVRRQAPLERLHRHPLRFSKKAEESSEPLRIEVMKVVAIARLALQPHKECDYEVPLFDCGDGAKAMSLGLRSRKESSDEKGHSDGLGMKGDNMIPKLERLDQCASAREYLEAHGLLRYIQALLHAILQDRPQDPYAYMMQQLSCRVSEPKGKDYSDVTDAYVDSSPKFQPVPEKPCSFPVAAPQPPQAPPPTMPPLLKAPGTAQATNEEPSVAKATITCMMDEACASAVQPEEVGGQDLDMKLPSRKPPAEAQDEQGSSHPCTEELELLREAQALEESMQEEAEACDEFASIAEASEVVRLKAYRRAAERSQTPLGLPENGSFLKASASESNLMQRPKSAMPKSGMHRSTSASEVRRPMSAVPARTAGLLPIRENLEKMRGDNEHLRLTVEDLMREKERWKKRNQELKQRLEPLPS
eukprot:TRINITY_DN76906_c0_g1_i1.p1 TRINITY_DN76906_c0_g1~~TRINITY_DN76906_c0_g1_i1.p1  ORF type:complete len:449 (+),score=100.86 TRINITY_DN76906_c0_g1_i1:31-1347(+)